MFYLGIDGGGTGCRAQLEDASGRVVSQAQAGAANVVTDREGALANIIAAAARACAGGVARFGGRGWRGGSALGAAV